MDNKPFLTYLKFSDVHNGRTYNIYLCSCGNTVRRRSDNSKRGKVSSCGCYNSTKTHGLWGTRALKVWSHMISRCYNKNDKGYKDYGGRGITVSDEWLDVRNFYRDMGEPTAGKQLDRIDNDKGYSKENCRWATREQQANNKRNNHFVEFNGEKRTITQWSRIVGIKARTINKRLNDYGWSPGEALTVKPVIGGQYGR